ncbi:MAG: DUF72 domain-containing protein [Spirochaetales bacterium]|nr:DUF72 domain-containing protein [Spirochaetales bacterium]
MAKVLIGTSGYYYTDWVGPFYPPGTGKDNFLQFYSEHFPFCELNFSYYQMPLRGKLIEMVQKTPKGFQFAIKAHKSITHERSPSSVERAEEFFHAISPMREENRLSAVLLQFPYSFHYTQENRKYLAEVLPPLKGLPLCIEFRNREWMLERVYKAFQERDITFVQTDTPELDNLPIATSITTSKLGYIRFHGRNKENWWNGDNTSRFDYLYQEKELQLWMCRIEEIAAKTEKLIIAFNNHYKANAISNARQLREMINKHTNLCLPDKENLKDTQNKDE